jgi:hypothetical protein
MKTNYRGKSRRRCETCKHSLNEYGQWLCMEGAEKIPPRGHYVAADDTIGNASIFRPEVAKVHDQFVTDRAISKNGLCDEYIA